jgi:hypothetical protein
MSDGNSLALNVGGCATQITSSGIKAALNWLTGINDFRLISENGKLKITANDSVAAEIDLSGTLNRIVISKINAGEEDIFEIRTRGIQSVCTTNPTVGDSTPVASSQLPTIAPNLNLHIPSIDYQSLGGTMNLWVDLKFTPTDDDKLWWVLDNYGTNP